VWRDRNNGPRGGSNNLAEKYGYVKPKKKMAARAVTEPVIGQMTQTKALDTRIGEFYMTV
jgi:hypothetical protein